MVFLSFNVCNPAFQNSSAKLMIQIQDKTLKNAGDLNFSTKNVQA
jgi:hypothetical protein